MNHLSKFCFLIIIISLFTSCINSNTILLTKRGKTPYSIFLDPSAPESVKIAANDLQYYFTKVTGATPEIVVSSQIPANPYISLGSNVASKAVNIDVLNIPFDGFQIITKDKNLFISGPDTPDGEVNKRGGINNGTSNGVYTFLEDFMGVKWLMAGELGEEYEEIRSFAIPQINRIESSPFDYRIISLRERNQAENIWDRRMRLGAPSPIDHNHNWIETVPPTLYNKHPEWFAMKDGKRIPPIGNYYKLETTNPEMVNYFANKVIEAFKNDPKLRWYSLSPSDGAGYSESPESLALTEKDPHGQRSVSPLIYKFYNDVAKIVAKEFPDHMLGGYIYGDYHYPPDFKVEKNIALMLPTGTVSGFKLYREKDRKEWLPYVWVPEWSEKSKSEGFDLYYYCFPISLMQHNGIITPPAPLILNSQFSDMVKYGFKGIYFYGNPIWPAFGPGNYTIAKLFWDPTQDANKILQEYYLAAYGKNALPYIEKFHFVLDSAYSAFMNQNMNAKYLLTEEHLKEIYAPNYQEFENNYLLALNVKKKPRQQQRLELLGNVLALMQWNLRDLGYLPEDLKTPLTLNDEQIDSLLTNQNNDCRITRIISYSPGELEIEVTKPLSGSKTREPSIIPVNRSLLMLLHVIEDGEVSINIEDFNKRAECNQYLLTDHQGKEIKTGIVSIGRTIKFNGKSGLNYYFSIPSRNASAKISVKGASVAYKIPLRGMQIDGAFLKAPLSVYFYVPENIKSFNLTMGNKGAFAEVFSPDGKKMGDLDNTLVGASNLFIPENKVKEGFYKIIFHKGAPLIALDEKLPLWFITDPAYPLKILSKQ